MQGYLTDREITRKGREPIIPTHVVAASSLRKDIEMSVFNSTVHNFYYLSEQQNGLWEVRETVTNQPVSLNGQFCCSLKKRDAEELIEYLNGLDASLAA